MRGITKPISKTLISSFLLFLLVGGLFIIPQAADAYIKVKGYYRSNGTYVQPYVRSVPNALKYDNYSYKGGSLYNPSYSSSRSYSSSWYTPAWTTDSTYYSGKSLYNSKSSSFSRSSLLWSH
jgi:hypothetical protein